jgi:hypothetical protein
MIGDLEGISKVKVVVECGYYRGIYQKYVSETIKNSVRIADGTFQIRTRHPPEQVCKLGLSHCSEFTLLQRREHTYQQTAVKRSFLFKKKKLYLTEHFFTLHVS